MKEVVILFLLFLVSCTQHDSFTLQGYIDGQYTQLSSNIAGKLEKLYVNRGQTVAKGQSIFELDREPEASQLRQAQASLEAEKSKLKDYYQGQRSTVLAGIIAQREQFQADLELSKNNFNRIATLYEKGVVSRSNYDEALATLKSNQQKVNQYEQNLREAELGERQYRILQQVQVVESQEAALRAARWRLEQKSVYAPDSGFVYDTYFNEGEQISANQAVVSLLVPRYVWLIFYIPEPMRAKITLNMKISFTCDGCKEAFDAYINYISPQAEYTPPVIFSRESRAKLVYRVQARLPLGIASKVNPGQPADVLILRAKRNPSFLRKLLWNLKNTQLMLKA